jgi:hypothetical protein
MGEHAEGLLPGDKEDMPDIASGDRKWLKLVRDSYRLSTDFLDDGIRSEWENALHRFHSEHPPGSKYSSQSYRNRSKIFRPKTRSAARRAEAKAAIALFSNTDLVDVRGQNRGDPVQADAARFRKALLQYRLEHSIPWFLTAMGARQDTYNYGVCCSLLNWEFEVQETREIVPVFDEMGMPVVDEDGVELGEEQVTTEIKHDRPVLDLVPPDNIRFNPNADWRNPIQDSPVVTIMIPMFVGDIVKRMKTPNPVTGQPDWRNYSVSEILASDDDSSLNETVRQARVGRNRKDPRDSDGHNEQGTVWVYLNIVRDEGEDYAFYSLGSHRLLSEPEPVEEVLPLGRDSITFGFSVLEAHRPYPSGGNRLAAPMQAEINDVTNQRMDNVKLALNKRYIIKRGTNVDTSALMRSVPGGGVMANDPEGDVRVLDFPDVTGSSYQEQDRLSQELDELTGNFSSSSVQANRALNETVGGMNMLQGDASEVAEYELRTFVETWVEPVLRKLDKLIAMFETDAVIKSVASENAELQMYGVNDDLDFMLDHEMVVSVNVGMGNTSPQQRMQKFNLSLSAAAAIPQVAARLNAEELGKEIFALGGFSDASRFFMSEEQFQQMMAQQQQGPQDNSLQVAQVRADATVRAAEIAAGVRERGDQLDFDEAMAKIAAETNIKLEDLYAKMGIEQEKLQTQRDITAAKEGSRHREMNLRRDTGAGI